MAGVLTHQDETPTSLHFNALPTPSHLMAPGNDALASSTPGLIPNTAPTIQLTSATSFIQLMPDVQTKCDACAKEEQVQRKTAGSLIQKEDEEESTPAEDEVECEGKTDITSEFHTFVAGLNANIDSMTDITPEQNTRLKALQGYIFANEGDFDYNTASIFSCTAINLDLAGYDTFKAYVEPNTGSIYLGPEVYANLQNFNASPNLNDLLLLMRTFGHERYHVVLSDLIEVDPSTLQNGGGAEEASGASYIAEEILAVAEELAIVAYAHPEDFAMGDDPHTPTEAELGHQTNATEYDGQIYARDFQRLWNDFIAKVTSEEAERIRGIIQTQLRSRYGSSTDCDNKLSTGILNAMETGRWYWCQTDNGTVGSSLPDFVHPCDNVCTQ